MEESSKRFLEKNLPEALEASELSDALDMLFDLIEKKGTPRRITMSTTISDVKHRECMTMFFSAISHLKSWKNIKLKTEPPSVKQGGFLYSKTTR